MRKSLNSLTFFTAMLCLLASAAFAEEPYRPVKTTLFPFGSASQAMTSDIGTNIRVVRLLCTATCYVAIGTTSSDALAVAGGTTSHFLAANEAEYFKVGGGANIAVIQVSGAGNLYVTEMSK